jgi:predicted nucleotidyltransferase
MFLDTYKNQIKILCEKHNVKYLYVFGSVVSERFSKNSDIDFFVDIDIKDPIKYANNYFSLKFELENLLKRNIDLLEVRAINNPYLLKSIEKSMKPVYGA